jgi:flagellar motor switch protein FliG
MTMPVRFSTTFTERLRNDVVLRIATLEGIQPAALRELNEAMLRILSGSTSIKRTAMGGVRTVAEILNFIGTANETSVVDAIREYDPDLAQKILDEMFVFENLMDIDDRSIQMIMREVQSDSLVMALKGASPELREKYSRTCRSGQPKCCAKTSNRRGRSACRKSRPSRRKS